MVDADKIMSDGTSIKMQHFDKTITRRKCFVGLVTNHFFKVYLCTSSSFLFLSNCNYTSLYSGHEQIMTDIFKSIDTIFYTKQMGA